jgi:hypothetical protein
MQAVSAACELESARLQPKSLIPAPNDLLQRCRGGGGSVGEGDGSSGRWLAKEACAMRLTGLGPVFVRRSTCLLGNLVICDIPPHCNGFLDFCNPLQHSAHLMLRRGFFRPPPRPRRLNHLAGGTAGQIRRPPPKPREARNPAGQGWRSSAWRPAGDRGISPP